MWELTAGQPWLVNALAYETCFRNKAGRDRSRPVTADDIHAARERLILRRETHLDQLTDKLQEERVRRVVEPLLSGGGESRFSTRDLEYGRDLGLIAQHGPLRIANPIYAEPVVAAASWRMPAAHREQRLAASRPPEYGLDAVRRSEPEQIMLAAFQEFEPGANSAALVIERKFQYRGLERTIREGLTQTRAYMERCGAAEGHLVVFDRTEGTSWDRKMFRREETAGGPPVTVWGM